MRRTRLQRGVFVVLALWGYAVATTNYPVWQAPTAQRGGDPFPCQAHSCGCDSAEQCWGHCCCFSLDERLAWAEQNHVQPPAFVLAQVKQRQQTASCSPSGCSSCCSSGEKESPPPEAAEAPQVRWVLGIQARRCRGLSTEWNAFGGAVAPPPPRVAWSPQEPWTMQGPEAPFFLRQVFLDRLTPPG